MTASSPEDESTSAAESSAADAVLADIESAIQDGNYRRARRLANEIPPEELDEEQAAQLHEWMAATGHDRVGWYIAIAAAFLLLLNLFFLYL